MNYYRIYGREKGKGRFKAIDLESGAFVGNLIYATYFLDKTDAEKCLSDLIAQNEGFEFKLVITKD